MCPAELWVLGARLSFLSRKLPARQPVPSAFFLCILALCLGPAVWFCAPLIGVPGCPRFLPASSLRPPHPELCGVCALGHDRKSRLLLDILSSVRSCRISFPCTLQSGSSSARARAPPSDRSCPSAGARVSHDLAFSLALLSRRPERGAGSRHRGVKGGGEQVPREGTRPVSRVPPVHGGPRVCQFKQSGIKTSSSEESGKGTKLERRCRDLTGSVEDFLL